MSAIGKAALRGLIAALCMTLCGCVTLKFGQRDPVHAGAPVAARAA
jgi:hypothetical protein